MEPFTLDAIDAAAWPGVAELPRLRFTGVRSRRAEAEFAQACADAELNLEGDEPDLVIHHDGLFTRLAASGWTGLAESYLAGEWTAPSPEGLQRVLRALLKVGFHPKTPAVADVPATGGELPHELVRLYAGDGISPHPGIYSTGVPTTVRNSVATKSSGRGTPKSHFVDVTTLSAPHAVDRDDLGSAQERAAQWLVDAARVGTGSHVLVYPASGARAAVQAADRRAIVDVLTADPAMATATKEYLVLAGAADSVHVELVPEAIPGAKTWRGRYDGIVSVELVETLTRKDKRRYFAALDRLLHPNGRAVVQSVLATEKLSAPGRDSLAALKAYVWPNLDLLTMEQLRECCEQATGLRIISEVYSGSHYAEGLAQQRSFFAGRTREAAAAGFDAVFRRLWLYQFALRGALFDLGMLEAVHVTAVHRHRGGRR